MAEIDVVKISDNIELDLDALDDKEFDIPPVDNPPSLESILNESEDGGLPEEDFIPSQLLQGDQGETGSISSADGILGDKPKRKQKKNIRYAEHGQILRHVILKGISAQIMSAVDRIDAGMPTALAVSTIIAVGTSHGLVLVFDPKQVLKTCLGSTAVGAQYGAVSAMSFNRDCTRLLAGFAKGQITMWDLTNNKLLRTITGAHPPGTAILHVKFTDDLTIAVTSDSGGSVFELEFKRLIGVRTCESKCLFSGSRGEVCTIEPLHMNHTIQDHPMKDTLILAMGSLSKILVVTIRPQLRVICMHELKGDPSTLPLLAWQFVIIQVSERDRVIDPVLAFARDQTIHFLQVVCNSPDDIKVVPLQKTELSYRLLAIVWMNSRTMVVIDTSERAHVIDVRTEEELEVIDLIDVQLVYSTSFYKSLATGGNVSKALAYAGERACYQSIATHSGQLVLLGTKGIHVLTMRSWKERLDALLKQKKYQDALTLALSFYKGKAKAVVGLSGGTQRRKLIVGEQILHILNEYVDVSMSALCPSHGRVEELEEHFQMVIPVCVDYCLTLDRVDLLFGSIYERFSADPIAKGTFLECLEPYILSDKLTYITPAVMQDFVHHYEQKGMVQNVEACIVHMAIASLDIHQVVSLCWQHGLYDAILYIYNKGMQDYLTPLDELMTLLIAAVNCDKPLTDDQIKLGNKLLVYISCCLAGRAYPFGDIPPDQVNHVKEEVFKRVTCLHTPNCSEDEPAYPYLKALLKFDTREFFNVLAMAFEEPEFASVEGLDKRQRVVDILLQIMVESIGFSATQIGVLFTFLARQMARHENTIIVNRVLFEQVLESLCSSAEGESESRHEERQQALIELLNAGGLEHFNEDRLLRLAENAKFYRVCESLYQKRKEYDKILLCYWKDPARKHQSFSYIEHILTSDYYSKDDKEKVEQEAISHIEELVSIDNKKTAQLVIGTFHCCLTDIITKLGKNEESLLKFLDGIFEQRDASNNAGYNEIQFNIEPSIHELYIELLCKYEANKVLPYVQQAEGYRLDETLEICRRFNLSNVVAFLLEKSGDIQGAFDLIMEIFQNKLADLIAVLQSSTSSERKLEHDLDVCWKNVKAAVTTLVQLCQRNSMKFEEREKQALWFPILDIVMGSQRKLKDIQDNRHLQGFKELTNDVLNSMMGYIPLQSILQKLLQDPTYSSGKFCDIKDLLLGMLDTCNYEKTLLSTCNNLVNHDLYRQLALLCVTASRGIIPKQDACNICLKPFNKIPDSIVCFRCGHVYHVTCLKSASSADSVVNQTNWMCHICNKTRRQNHMTSHMKHQTLVSSQPQVDNTKTSTSGRKTETVLLEQEQMQAIDNLRRVQKTTSRLAILSELARQERAGGPSKYKPPANSIFHKEQFQLRLAAPPPDFQ